MLQEENYIKYYDENKRALQKAKFFLSRWGKIENNISNLSPRKKRIAKMLFSTLKKLTKEEREFLASKYRVVIFGKASRTDKEVAAMYDMDFQDYVMLRRSIEYKFYYYLKDLIDK